MKLHKCEVCVYWGLNGLVKLITTFAVYREFTTLCNLQYFSWYYQIQFYKEITVTFE